ncbi:MAG: hypothetical protein CSB21_00685, partial [Deltaproteobacteria bacterium]
MAAKIGVVTEIKGNYYAIDKDGNIRVLKSGDPVYEGDEVRYEPPGDGEFVSESTQSQDKYIIIEDIRTSKLYYISDEGYMYFDSQDLGSDAAKVDQTSVLNKPEETDLFDDQSGDPFSNGVLAELETFFSIPDAMAEPVIFPVVPEKDPESEEGSTSVVNTAPVITGEETSGNINEITDGSTEENIVVHKLSGKMDYTDLDTNDSHTLTFSPKDNDYKGNFTARIENGEIVWDFNVEDKNIDILKEGESLTQIYTITLDDGNGGTAVKDVVITINGSNDAPVITSAPDDASGSVTENAGTSTVSGTLSFSDVDADSTAVWSLVENNGTYGSISINPDTGEWTYTLDNSLGATQALKEGETKTETFTATVTDENGATVSQTITITINGSNNAPEITSDASSAQGSLTEDEAITTTSGTLTASDADVDATSTWSVTGSSDYGTISIDPATGEWTYNLDNSLDATQNLDEGDIVTETFTATVTDDNGATATETITVTIKGTNDVPEITSGEDAASGEVVEAGHLDNGTVVPGTPSVSGTLTSSDVDEDATATWSVAGTSDYGTISIDPATGEWTYNLDNSLAATQALKEGESVEQTFTATVTDDKGATATQEITITINGTNDAPVITSNAAAATGSVTEAGSNDDGT